MTVLNEARRLIEGRLEELERERQKLSRALQQLDGGFTRRGPGRPNRAAAKRAAPKKRRGRRSGGRAEQAVKLIQDNPGITAGEVAKKLKIKPNYLYRVLGQLEKEGRVKKEGRRYRAG